MIKLKTLLVESKNLIVYHGTNLKYLPNIKSNGLISKSGYDSAKWYMLATDFESALFHANPSKEGEKAIVVEFSIPVTNEKWFGYPYLWPASKRNSKSSWFALKAPLPKNFIKKIHQVDYNEWLDQKNRGF